MKSEKSKEFIDGCMSHLEVDMSEHAKWQLRTAMANVAELAEEDARVRAGIAFVRPFTVAETAAQTWVAKCYRHI